MYFFILYFKNILFLLIQYCNYFNVNKICEQQFFNLFRICPIDQNLNQYDRDKQQA
jgi:hypothetical protein